MKWWKWQWDRVEAKNVDITFTCITRWRRGWITIYKLEDIETTEWTLWFPFNIIIGIQLNRL